MFLAAVMLGLVEEWGEHLAILYRFVSDLQAESLIGLNIDHDMHLDPAPPDPPLLTHPLTSIRNLDPGAIDGDSNILGEVLGCYFERKIQGFDPAEKGGIIRRLKTRDEWCKFPDKPFHLAVGHMQEGVDLSHPHNKTLRILKRPARFASVHLSEFVIPLIDEVKAEVELSALDQPFVIYNPVAIIGIRASPAFSFSHEGAEGTSSTFYFLVKRSGLCNTAQIDTFPIVLEVIRECSIIQR